MSAQILKFKLKGEPSRPDNKEDTTVIFVNRNSDQERTKFVLKGLKVIHWKHPEEQYVEYGYASLCYEQDGKTVVIKQYLDSLQPIAVNKEGAFTFRLRRPFAHIMNLGLAAAGMPTFDDTTEYMEVVTKAPVTGAFDHWRVVNTPD